MMIRSSAVLLLLSSSQYCCDARLNPHLLRGDDTRTAQMTSSAPPHHVGVNDGVDGSSGVDIPALVASAAKSDTTADKSDQVRFLVDNEGQGPVKGPGPDVLDTPIETNGSPSQDLDPFEDLQEDIADPPSGVDESFESSSSAFSGIEEAEIPEMEPIPLEFMVNQPDVVDESLPDSSSEKSGMETELASGLDQEAEIPGMERIPPEREHFVFNPAEWEVLSETSSVCAGSLVEAQANCVVLPLCKFSVRDNEVSNELVPGQGQCSRRCDSPILSDDHCAPGQQCYHFIFGCACSKLASDGGECQPF